VLRYKTKTRPGLVALYDIRPGNGVGLFLQPRSPHGAMTAVVTQTEAQISQFKKRLTRGDLQEACVLVSRKQQHWIGGSFCFRNPDADKLPGEKRQRVWTASQRPFVEHMQLWSESNY